MSTEPVIVTWRLLAPPPVDIAAIEADAVDAAGEDAEAPAPRPGTSGPTVLAEADAAAFFAAAPDRLAPPSEQGGAIEIACGGAFAGFADTLLWLAPRLCFQAVEALSQGGSFTLPLFSSTTEVTLSRDGEVIEITADIMDPVQFPAGPLLEALHGAGQRLVALAETLWAGDGDLAVMLPWIYERDAAARAQLDAATAPAEAPAA